MELPDGISWGALITAAANLIHSIYKQGQIAKAVETVTSEHEKLREKVEENQQTISSMTARIAVLEKLRERDDWRDMHTPLPVMEIGREISTVRMRPGRRRFPSSDDET